MLRREPFLSRRAGAIVMAVVAIAGGAIVVYLARRWNLFFYDEWGTIFYRREGGVDAFLAPHNGHLQATMIAVYRLFFATVGLEHYWPYRAAITIAHLALVALLFVYARGRVQSEIAILLSVLVLLLGQAWEVLFWPTEVQFVFPLVAFVGVLLLWERTDRGRLAGTAGLTIFALASSGVGVAVTAGLAAEAVRRRMWRRVAAVAIPGGLYLAWFALYRPSATSPPALRMVPGAAPNGDVGATTAAPDLSHAPGYLFHLAEAAANSLIGRSATGGPVPLIALAILAVTVLVLRPQVRAPLVPIAVTLGAFWLLATIARGGTGGPAQSRYVYPAVVLIVLAAAVALRGIAFPRAAVAVAAAIAAVIVAANIRTFNNVSDGADRSFDIQRAELRALPGTPGPPSYQPDPLRLPGVSKGAYKAAVEDLGFPPGTEPRARP